MLKKSLFMLGQYSRSRKPGKSAAQVRKLITYLGREVRDIERKIKGDAKLAEAFSKELALEWRILRQPRGDKGKVYSVHEPDGAVHSEREGSQEI
jgi:hypothetical protein